MAQTCVDSVRRALLAGALACLAPAVGAGGIDTSGGGDRSPVVTSAWLIVGAPPSRVAPHPRLLPGRGVAHRDRLPTVCWYHHSTDTSEAAGVARAGEWSATAPGRLVQLPVSPGERKPQGRGESGRGNDEHGEGPRSAQGPGTLHAGRRSPQAGAGVAPSRQPGTNLPEASRPGGLDAAREGEPSSRVGNPRRLQHPGASSPAPDPGAAPGGGPGSPPFSTPPARPTATGPAAVAFGAPFDSPFGGPEGSRQGRPQAQDSIPVSPEELLSAPGLGEDLIDTGGLHLSPYPSGPGASAETEYPTVPEVLVTTGPLGPRPVPEPATLPLVGAGLAALVTGRRSGRRPTR